MCGGGHSVVIDEANRSAHCVYRASAAERRLTQVVAARAGLSVSAYIRQAVLFSILLEGDQVEVRAAIAALGPDGLPLVQSKLRYLESVLHD